MTNHLNWGSEQENVDYADSTYILYLLMVVHLISFYLSRYMIGTKKYADAYEKLMFSRNYYKLSMMLMIINLPVSAIAVN